MTVEEMQWAFFEASELNLGGKKNKRKRRNRNQRKMNKEQKQSPTTGYPDMMHRWKSAGGKYKANRGRKNSYDVHLGKKRGPKVSRSFDPSGEVFTFENNPGTRGRTKTMWSKKDKRQYMRSKRRKGGGKKW